jgi:hypothetical protein
MATTEQEQSAEARQLRIPGFEGQTVDEIEVTFSGKVTLNMHDPDSAAFFKSLKWGKRCDLRLSGVVGEHVFSQKADAEGSMNRVSRRKVSIDTVEVGEE